MLNCVCNRYLCLFFLLLCFQEGSYGLQISSNNFASTSVLPKLLPSNSISADRFSIIYRNPSKFSVALKFGLNEVNFGLSDGGVESVILVSKCVAASGAGYLLLQFFAYWRIQIMAANIFSGIPKALTIVELDAQDGKNIFYLPQNSEYIGVMNSGKYDLSNVRNLKKIQEKSRMNEQLILECIGKANVDNMNLSGKMRERTQDIPSKTVDCVISVNSLERAKDTGKQIELVSEVYRMLKPGGLFVFVEADNDDVINRVFYSVFPEKIKETKPAGPKLKAKKNNRNKKGKKTVKQISRLQQREESMKEAVATKSGDLESIGSDAENVNAINTNATETESSVSSDAHDDDSSVSNKRKERPSITYEKINNFIFPYVTGIAVKP